jgi:hypothetical protein
MKNRDELLGPYSRSDDVIGWKLGCSTNWKTAETKMRLEMASKGCDKQVKISFIEDNKQISGVPLRGRAAYSKINWNRVSSKFSSVKYNLIYLSGFN